jgi:HSP20 family protein
MTITRYYPWAQNHRFQDQINHVFNHVLGEEETGSSNIAATQWAPRVDIREEDKRFVILVDVPGVEPKGIEINMDKGILSIKGERKSDNTDETAKTTRVERSYGSFYRRFALPDSANAEGISASGKHGVLEISIPKKPETTPRRIEVAH